MSAVPAMSSFVFRFAVFFERKSDLKKNKGYHQSLPFILIVGIYFLKNHIIDECDLKLRLIISLCHTGLA